jgi:ketosteroid isomerase-like protein
MTIMRSSAILVARLLIPAVLWGQATPPQRSPAEQEVRTLQDQLINAYKQRDLTALERILADDYTFVESHGRVLRRADLVQNFGSGDRVLTSYAIDDDHVSLYGEAAVMTYHYRTREKYRGEDQSGDFRMIRVFARRNNRWQMVAAQETAITPAPK